MCTILVYCSITKGKINQSVNMIRNSHYQTEELLSLEIKTTPNNEHNKTLNEFIFMVLKKIHS